MRTKDLLFYKAVAAQLGLSTNAPDPAGTSAPEPVPVDERINAAMEIQRVAITGQETPIGPPMRNRSIALKVFAIEPRVDTLEQLFTQLLALSTATAEQATVLTAQQQLSQQTTQALQAKQAATDLRLAANEAKDQLTANATEANRLDILALKAADVLLQAQDTKDAQAIAAAQASATQARAVADAAMKKAEDNAATLLVVQGQVVTAQTTATNAQAAVTTLAARFRSATVPVPSMALGGSVDVEVKFPAFPDNAFVAIAEPAGLTLLGLDATEVTTARTASSATFRIKNVLGLTIASGGTLTFFAYRP